MVIHFKSITAPGKKVRTSKKDRSEREGAIIHPRLTALAGWPAALMPAF